MFPVAPVFFCDFTISKICHLFGYVRVKYLTWKLFESVLMDTSHHTFNTANSCDPNKHSEFTLQSLLKRCDSSVVTNKFIFWEDRRVC